MIDARIERLDLALEDFTGKGRDSEFDRSLRFEPAQFVFRDREIDPDRIERLQPDQRLPDGHVLASFDTTQAKPAGERRGDILMRDMREVLLHGGGSGVTLGDRCVERRLRDRPLAHQLRLPVVFEIRHFQNRLIDFQLGLLHRGIELDELRALLDVLAAVEEIVDDHAAHFRRHVDALDGEHRADRMHLIGPSRGLGLLGRDRRRRRHHLRHELADEFRLHHELEIADAPEEQGDNDGGNDKTFDHGARSGWARSGGIDLETILGDCVGRIVPHRAAPGYAWISRLRRLRTGAKRHDCLTIHNLD